MSLSQHDIEAIAQHVAVTLFDMGARDAAAVSRLAREFAPVAYRSLASAIRNGDVPVPVQDEQQQVLEWQSCS